MANSLLDGSALESCLDGLNHLFIDIARLKHEPIYEERRGGFCDLQVATLDPETPSASKLVAAKKLRLGTRFNDPKRLAFRLARELKVWAGLRHPHVLPLLGFYLGDNLKTAVLISEYMIHGDLKDYLTKMKPSYHERLSLVRDLTDGLDYLHTQTVPVRHGDLKPGNVLVNFQRRALLADFGLSRALDSGPTGFTTGNDTRGTVRFSGPEVLLQGVDAQSLSNDMWSWACLVVEAMIDKIPFSEILSEPMLIVALIQGQTPCDLDGLALDLPQFSDLLVKCWNREPEQRPTAADCLVVIQSSLDSLLPPTLSQQPATPPRVHSITHPSLMLQASSQVNEQADSGPSYQFHEFFAATFSRWRDKQPPISPSSSSIEGQEVELHELFLFVGALGGHRAVSESMLWQAVGAKMGLPHFDDPILSSTRGVAVQLSKIYEKALEDFEASWNKSFRPDDPNTTFPLPPPLRHLHPEIERLTVTLLPQSRPPSRARGERSHRKAPDDKSSVKQPRGSLRQVSDKSKTRKKRLEIKKRKEFSDETDSFTDFRRLMLFSTR